jgi:alpha-amylase
VQPEEYTGFGEVFEFQYARDLGPALKAGIVGDPELGDTRPLHVDPDRAVVFVDNHDTERGEASLTYRDGGLYLIANALMLADGTPVVYSGYAFSDRDAALLRAPTARRSAARATASPGRRRRTTTANASAPRRGRRSPASGTPALRG